ncbi:hypothetical protein [Rhizohabitans arisaemae]|uniref:hypothetical protein n=1 Tax=Rhizohabitans arisaemae TaxID=2720610 RepID=UPI0024B05DBF|nr:hypothetical protein [Rhizohabitans arisaemae]
MGVAYEVTLELTRDGEPYGAIGVCCGWSLAAVACEVRAARSDAGQRWADPDDRFPDPGNGELFAFRRRDRFDRPGEGELRCRLRTKACWIAGPGTGGAWRLSRHAFVEAWGAAGVGVRAILTSSQLESFLREMATEAECLLGGGSMVCAPNGSGIPAAPTRPGGR